MKNPFLAAFLSFVLPGLGQLYLKDTGKGWALLCMDIGVGVSLIFNHSWIALLMLGLIYLFILFPAVVDAYQDAGGKRRTFKGESVPYVIVMLLVIGPFAIPLLWQSSNFSKGSKIGWTILVIVLALLVIVAIMSMASFLDTLMKQSSSAAAF